MLYVRPTYHVESFADVPVRELADLGIEGIAVDIDQNITSHKGTGVSVENIATFNRMAEYSMAVLLFSNADKPIRQDRAHWFRNHVQDRSHLDEVGLVLSGVVGHRKGHPAMFREACKQLGVEPEHMAVVDDQQWRGVRGGNRYGYGVSILVDPIGKSGNILKDYPMRWTEKLFGLILPPVYDVNSGATEVGDTESAIWTPVK